MMRLFAGPAVSSPPDDDVRSTDRAEPALTALALRVGAIAASQLRLHDALAEVCRTLPDAAGAAGAVVVLSGSVDVVASDAQAAWLGELQRRAGAGPLGHALRSGRPMVTPDLTRVGPPDLAAAAAERGYVTSVVLPLMLGDRLLGSLQLLGDARRRVGMEHITLVRPLAAALSARLLDASTIEELSRAADRTVWAGPASAPSPVSPAQPGLTGYGPAEGSAADRRDAQTSQVVGWFGPVEPQPAGPVNDAGR
jgi:transcriptional regulator with GAF, ATPase, and Fis domain